MRLVKFYGPNERGLDHPIWINREYVVLVRKADDDWPGCAFIYTQNETDPIIVQGTVDVIVWDLRNAP